MKLHQFAIVLAVAGLALSGCGGSSPSSPPQAGSQPQQELPSIPPKAKKYSWGLPLGDVSPNYNEKTVYDQLRSGDCAGAQSDLDGYQAWQGFSSPRNVLLAQAAIEFCRGETSKATALYRRAESMGWKGLLREDGKAHASCEFYKSSASVVEQRPRTDFSCPTGTPPPWKHSEQQDRQDPR